MPTIEPINKGVYDSTKSWFRIFVMQESAELRVPLEIAELVDAVDGVYSKVSNRAPPEVFLELRAQLTTATPWAPMVR